MGIGRLAIGLIKNSGKIIKPLLCGPAGKRELIYRGTILLATGGNLVYQGYQGSKDKTLTDNVRNNSIKKCIGSFGLALATVSPALGIALGIAGYKYGNEIAKLITPDRKESITRIEQQMAAEKAAKEKKETPQVEQKEETPVQNTEQPAQTTVTAVTEPTEETTVEETPEETETEAKEETSTEEAEDETETTDNTAPAETVTTDETEQAAPVQTEETTQPKDEIYTVKAGDCIWNIAKAKLRAKNPDKEPTNAEILDLTLKIIKKNNLHFESDNYRVMIHPDDKLKMVA